MPLRYGSVLDLVEDRCEKENQLIVGAANEEKVDLLNSKARLRCPRTQPEKFLFDATMELFYIEIRFKHLLVIEIQIVFAKLKNLTY
jgi:hypothetical protein